MVHTLLDGPMEEGPTFLVTAIHYHIVLFAAEDGVHNLVPLLFGVWADFLCRKKLLPSVTLAGVEQGNASLGYIAGNGEEYHLFVVKVERT